MLLRQYESHPNALISFHATDVQSNCWVKIALKYARVLFPFSWWHQQFKYSSLSYYSMETPFLPLPVSCIKSYLMELLSRWEEGD